MAARPSSAARPIISCGCEAPYRNEKFVAAISSAKGAMVFCDLYRGEPSLQRVSCRRHAKCRVEDTRSVVSKTRGVSCRRHAKCRVKDTRKVSVEDTLAQVHANTPCTNHCGLSVSRS